jgi:TolB-like protein/Tfp pilus assembly protein PilF
VLPLKNVSGDPQQDFFAEGMTEALITELGKIGALRVLSYQSLISYRQTAKPLGQIARELNVGTFLEGSVFHSGERVRITANLIQASPERHLWAESYEFNLRDVLAVQGEVARDIARRIRVNVTAGEQVRLTTSRRVDSEAYEAYLLGRAHLTKTPTQTSWTKAKEYFEKAIDKDPGYAPAYAALAQLYIHHRGITRKSGEARHQARLWGEKALKLDETLAEGHAVLGRAAQQDWDWADAEREFRRALELNPSHATARIWYAMYLYGMQRFEDAVVQAKRAQQLDPVSPHVNTWAGGAYFAAGRVEEAIASARKALEVDATYFDGSLVLGRIHVTQGKYDEAIAELQQGLALNKGQQLLLGALAHAYARAGQREKALGVVEELNRIEVEQTGYTPFGLIWAYAGLGDNERAFTLLEKAYQEVYGRMVWLNVDPLLEPLSSDPRFRDLARRVGLPTLNSPPSR